MTRNPRAPWMLALLLACEPTSPSAPPPAVSPVSSVAASTDPGASRPKPSPPPATTARKNRPAAAPAATPAAAPTDPLARPAAAVAAKFRAGAEDVLQPTSEHYLKSNERRHDVWFPYIEGIGGVYVGVGADQNYTLLTTARSRWVFLLDIDPRVPLTHRAYEIFVEASETPEALVARFSEEAKADSVALLESKLASAPEEQRRAVVQNYKGARETLRRHLAHVLTRTRDGQPASWLSDPERYQWLRRLFLADRIRIMKGDLTGPESMRTIAKATRAVGSTVRVLYLSNAEEYFRYGHGTFRANVVGLPVDPRSVVLRTLYGDKWTHADSLWNYQVQPLTHFQEMLTPDGPPSRNKMIAQARADEAFVENTGVKGLSLMGHPAALAPRPKDAR